MNHFAKHYSQEDMTEQVDIVMKCQSLVSVIVLSRCKRIQGAQRLF